jgi:hypothetical protein
LPDLQGLEHIKVVNPRQERLYNLGLLHSKGIDVKGQKGRETQNPKPLKMEYKRSTYGVILYYELFKPMGEDYVYNLDHIERA